jgi:hypothetical protein
LERDATGVERPVLAFVAFAFSAAALFAVTFFALVLLAVTFRATGSLAVGFPTVVFLVLVLFAGIVRSLR